MEEPTESGSRPLPSSRAVEYIARGVRLLARSIIDMWDIRSETQRLVSAILPPSSLSPPGPQSALETVFTFPIAFQASAWTASSRDSRWGPTPQKKYLTGGPYSADRRGWHPDPRKMGARYFIIVLPDTRTQFVLPCHVKWLLKMNGLWARGNTAEVVFRNAGWKWCFCSLTDTYCWEKDTLRGQWCLATHSTDGQANFTRRLKKPF